jgi:RNA polymerase sigma-70 factor (ECF subfamily)
MKAGMSADDSPSAEELLIGRLRKGDRLALGELFDLHRERLWRMVRFRMDRRVAVRLDPDDVLQEAFLAALQRIDHFLAHPEGSLFIWLRLIVGQTLIDVHRRHVGAEMRDAGRDVSIDKNPYPQATSVCLAAELAGSFTSPSQAAAGVELSEQLEKAISSMASLDQEIIALRHFEDLTNVEAAELLDISPTAASNRYVRAIARLKDVLSAFSSFTGPR